MANVRNKVKLNIMDLPPVIKKLDETVVNRIAAGEVIQRPANAVKELLENSLDAKSTTIQITLKGGGLKLLQIQDNGTGIRREDMEIVCERFTTSKLTEFEDLSTIATFGFRGEALASISHVAHLTITTKTATEQCAYRASYEDGKLKGPPKACAGNQGTQISAEDLFYNILTRKKALKSHAEEHSRVADVVSRYAVHNPAVGFTLKKQGESLAEIKTNPNSTHVDNIRTIYGNNIARELLEINTQDDTLKFKLNGFISNVNFSTKKQIFLLFINHRLVDSPGLRKSLESVYSLYLGKGAHPFMYLSLELDPRSVDVNMHPTKHQVHFLHEEAIVEKTRQTVEALLLGANSSRVFHTQAKLPGAAEVSASAPLAEKCSPTAAVKKAPQHLVRTDSNTQKLDKFFSPQTNKKQPNNSSADGNLAEERREITLTSVLGLQSEVESEGHIGLRKILADCTFVGCVDKTRSLIQHSTKLFLCNTQRLMEEMFYQIMVYEFGNFGAIKFKEGLPLRDVVLLCLDWPEAGWLEEHGPKEEIADSAVACLSARAAMLADYFSMDLDQQGSLCTIPLLLANYEPDMTYLPLYMLKLASDVNWENETLCFQSFCRETARFYSHLPLDNNGEDEDSEVKRDWKWTVEHVIYPTLRESFLPPRRFIEDETIIQIASLPELYKVFERC